MNNKLRYVGFLGLLGIAHNYVYFALFSFLYYLRYFWVIPDELFKENIRRAAAPSFFTSMVLYAITVALSAFHVSTLIFVIGLVANFVVPFILFTILLTSFEMKESWSKQS